MRILRGASIELHEVQEEHLLLLAEWRNSEDFMRLCSTRRNTVTPVEFAAELGRDLNRDRHEQFLIWRKGTYVGTIYSYNLNCTDSYAFVTTFIAKAWRARGYGAAAMVVFLDSTRKDGTDPGRGLPAIAAVTTAASSPTADKVFDRLYPPNLLQYLE